MAMGGLIALSFLAIRVLEQDVQAYRQSNQEAIHWSAAQVEVELSRFVLVLNRYTSGDPEVTQQEVNRRFDLLWSRTGLFRSGAIGARLRQSDQGLGVIPMTIEVLTQHEDTILNLERGQTPKNRQLLEEFSALQDPLRRLSVKVLASEQERYAGVRRTLLDSSRMTFWVWAATLVLAALLVGVLFLEARRYMRQIRETGRLAEEAQAANRAKSRFLTMMSHELRTPMNGVMGLMALAKQAGLNEKQLRLIEQAERSGAQMVSLLGDILDFSDLQSDRLVLDIAPFQPRALCEGVIGDVLGQSAPGQLEMTVECPGSVPEWVEGDVGRLRQSLVHFCTYFAETIGSRDIRLVVGHDEKNLIVEIDLAAQEADKAGWQPEAIFGSTGSRTGEFETDAVGPMIARSMVGIMDGALRMRRIIPGRASLIVQVPAPEMIPQRDCIRLVTHTDTTALLLNAAIDETVWTIWGRGLSPARVAVVLFEVGGALEESDINALRAAHPGSVILGIGTGDNQHPFDAICHLPVSRPALQALIEETLRQSAEDAPRGIGGAPGGADTSEYRVG